MQRNKDRQEEERPMRNKNARVRRGDDRSEPVPGDDDEGSVNVIMDSNSSVFSVANAKRMGLIDFGTPVVILRPIAVD